jgi:hypothetical protein
MTDHQAIAERIAKAFFDEQTYCLQQMKPFTFADGASMLNGGKQWTHGDFIDCIAKALDQASKTSTEQ